jgi:hypothetical protein
VEESAEFPAAPASCVNTPQKIAMSPTAWGGAGESARTTTRIVGGEVGTRPNSTMAGGSQTSQGQWRQVRPQGQLSPFQRADAKRRADGEPLAVIAKSYAVSVSMISR